MEAKKTTATVTGKTGLNKLSSKLLYFSGLLGLALYLLITLPTAASPATGSSRLQGASMLPLSLTSSVIQMESAAIAPGEMTTVAITATVPITASLDAFTIHIEFDPTIAGYMSCSLGSAFLGVCNQSDSDGLPPDVVSFSAVNPVGISGEVNLGDMTFSGVNPGTSALHIVVATWSDGTGSPPVTLDGQIIVQLQATETPLPTATNTPLPTPTNTPLPTATNTPLPTATNTPLPTATNTPLPTPTNTPLPTPTNTPLPTATNTPLPTATNTPLPTATNTPLPTVTNTPMPTATNTPLPTATNTPLPTATNTPEPGVTMHVGDLDGSSIINGNRWTAHVLVTIHDNNENPVTNATVNGTWSNGINGNGSCVTNGGGQCTVSINNIRGIYDSVLFTVDNVTHVINTYQAGDNHDPDGDSSGTTIEVFKTGSPPPTPTITPTPGPGVDIHVGDLDASSMPPQNDRWSASVTITVHDSDENPIAGAIVSGSWNSGLFGSGMCVTNALGQCTITKNNIRGNIPMVTFKVDDVTSANNTYDPAANHDPDGESDGTIITVFRP